MELCAANIVEGSGEEGSVERFATESLKAAVEEASGPHGLFVGYPARKKADDGKAVSGMEGTMAAVAVAMASASAAGAAAAAAAKHAAVAAAAAKQAADAAKQAGEAAAKQAEDANQKEEEKDEANQVEEASDDEDGDSDAEYDARMSGIEYILAYKELPQYEIDLILDGVVERVPFTDTERFKALAADPSVTQDDIDAAAKEHEDQLDTRVRFREYVRQEYEAKGYVEVSDEYIAKRVRTEELCNKVWEELFADSDGDDSYEDQEAGEEIAQ